MVAVKTPRVRRTVSILSAAIIVQPSNAYAHGLGVYLATPVTPPLGYSWIPPLFLASLVLLLAFLRHHYVRGESRKLSLFFSAVATGAFFYAFTFIGAMAARVSTAPPPGLCSNPHEPLQTLGIHSFVGPLFIAWNVAGILLLLVLSSLVVPPNPRPRRVAIALAFLLLAIPTLIANTSGSDETRAPMSVIVIFLISASILFRRKLVSTWTALLLLYGSCLLPFLFTGELSHGWGGGYFHKLCIGRIIWLSRASIRYARQHGDRLPNAKSAQEWLDAIRPFYSYRPRGFPDPLCCPNAAVFKGIRRSICPDLALAGSKLETLLSRSDNPILFTCKPCGVTATHDPNEISDYSRESYSVPPLSTLLQEIKNEPSFRRQLPLSSSSWFHSTVRTQSTSSPH